tara:strand:+ start:2081 stop:2614 length:534 start_codon:yes stop_codon:yes gene_type:complete
MKQKTNWIKSHIKDFKKKDIDTWKEHSIHHTKKHLDDMLKFYKEGKTFSQSHKLTAMPKTYTPKQLTKEDKKKQEKSILNKTDRPKLESFKSKRSGWAKKFEDKYNKKITDKVWINKNILKTKGQEEIIDKGMGAYYSSGSRPNQTPYSWGYGRLASVILNGASRKIDKKIWDKYKL